MLPVSCGQDARRRAMSLVRACLLDDLEAFHVCGPAKPEPTAETAWLDKMHYEAGQQKFNPDHELILALTSLIIEYGCGGNAARERILLQWLDSWLSDPPAAA